ncbi:ANTAR domain-containing protein [Bradyrhizobium sp. AUGA SZCCT0177]|uniref:ANTAR domain-containing response regulator n=1 Tax=Bradyrhizobium sp. AUGA SZCCT0177 TaxID=2807665 RepID=UPI001BA9DD41|nr:ANTAR domain-containing protein [Bradyrhizobium sp. AUGA SZCCT0177]
MSVALLKDLRDLNVLVIHPLDTEGEFLVDHLRRIGCTVNCRWPVPTELPAHTDVLFLSIDDETRPETERLLKSIAQPAPTILAIVSYENPSTLQIVLESGALAVIERPLKPFGLLTNLAIARNLWLQQQALSKQARKYKRRLLGDQRMAKAKAILMSSSRLSEAEAYHEIRNRAMASRVPVDEVANLIIRSEDMLRSRAQAD